MRACIYSMKGNFNKDIGQGVQRYMYEIWYNLDKIIKQPDSLDKLELGYGNNLKLRKASFTLQSLLHDFSNYDIIHAPAPIMYNPPKRGKAVTLTTVHELVMVPKDCEYLERMENGKKSPFEFIDSYIGARIKKQILNSDYIIVGSLLVQDEVIRFGVPREKTFLVNMGIDDRFTQGPTEKPGNHECFTIGYLGALSIRKNVQFLINAMKELDDKEACCRIYGKKSGEYENLVKLAGNDKRIAFMGFVPEDQLVQTYESFDVLVHPILYAGFELEILEAQSRGVPVIVYKNGIISEEVKKYCFVADDPKHAASIIAEIKKNGYNEKQRQAAMSYARSFTLLKCAEETLEIYKNLI